MNRVTRRCGPGPSSILIAGCVLLGALLAGCHGSTLTSVWRGDRPITIDGQKADWSGIDVYNFEDQKIYLGLTNDATSMYLLLITSNRMLAMQALTRGLKIRFHPEEGEEVLWLGCPRAAGMPGPDRQGGPERGTVGEGEHVVPGADLGAAGYGQGDKDDPSSGEGDGSPGGARGSEGEAGGGRGMNDSMIQRVIGDLPAEIEVFARTGDDSLRLSSEEAARRGIEEKASFDEGYFILEMKVPLTRDGDHPQAVGLRPGDLDRKGKANVVEVNFNIPKRVGGEGPSGGWRRGGEGGEGGGEGGSHLSQWGGGDRGGFPGGRGGRGGFGRGGMRRSFGDFLNGLDMTIKVRLSGGPAAK